MSKSCMLKVHIRKYLTRSTRILYSRSWKHKGSRLCLYIYIILWCSSPCLGSLFPLMEHWLFFPTEMGLHQGDSMSPHLLITVMKALSKLLERPVDLGQARQVLAHSPV